jgi:hypothetical protein
LDAWNEIKAGETLRLTLKMKDSATKQAVDLTGASAICHIRKTVKSAEILASPTITITDAENGEMELVVNRTQSLSLPTTGRTFDQMDEYVWEAFITYANGDTECIFDDSLFVRPSGEQVVE